MVARSLGNLGNVYFHRGMISKSEEYLEESLVLFEETGNPQDLALTLLNLGNICAQRGELERAEESLQGSRKLFDKIGNLRDLAKANYRLVRVLLSKNSLDDATDQVEQLVQLTQTSALPDVVVEHLLAKGLIKLKKQDLGSALDCCSLAKSRATQISHFGLQMDAM